MEKYSGKDAASCGLASRVIGLWALVLSLAGPAPAAEGLADLLALAQAEDPTYQAALAAREAIRFERRASLARLLPELSLEANAYGNSQDIEVARGAVGLGGDIGFQTERYEVRATQPILRFDRWVRLRQADKRVAQAEATLAAAWLDLMVRLTGSYLDAIAARDDELYAEATLGSLLEQRRQVRVQRKLGLATVAEELEAEAALDQAEAELLDARARAGEALLAIEEITAQPASDLKHLRLDAMPEPLQEGDGDYWAGLARSQNFTVAAARVQAEVLAREIRAQQAGHLPTVDFVAAYGYESQGGRFGDTDTTGGRIGVEVNMPLFSGGGISAATHVAVQRHAEAVARLERAERRAERDARAAWLRLQASVSASAAAEKTVASRQAALEALRVQYQSGSRTTADLIDAERELVDARRARSRVRYRYLDSLVRLRQAAGILDETDLQQLDAMLTLPGSEYAVLP